MGGIVYSPGLRMPILVLAMAAKMINRFHARFHRPSKGWDPVPSAHAALYSAGEWTGINEVSLNELEGFVGGFKRKKILDLGGGPGQYSVVFAQRGGSVVWHDISRNYREIARERARRLGVADKITFSLGYLDDAPRLLMQTFDLVFNRICWNYAFTDRSFTDVVYRLVRPGGFGYIDTTHSLFKRHELSTSGLIRTWLNERFAIKIGHPFPPRGRIARLLLRYPVERIVVDYRSPLNDRLMFQRPSHRVVH
jgi:SAM-dependent methyltransferase